jgi:hypothetical protein
MIKVHCEGCGDDVSSHDITHYGSEDGSYRELCNRCFSAEVAKACGLDNINYARLEPIGITDCDGVSHQFHFATRLLGRIVTLDAFELKDGQQTGYKFQLIGDPEEDQFALLGRMIEKIRKALSIKYIKDNGDGHGVQIVDMMVCGRFEGDLSQDAYMPSVVVDGQEISWVEFGRMIRSFEGWQFKLEIIDRSDEL